MKVLIADDDPVWLKLLEKNIDSWGYATVIATNGQQAWDVLQGKQAPRVAILDWQMPELDGVEICHRIRRSLHLPFIYTIILTSRNTRDDMVIGLESGADDYLVKPIDMAILRSRLMAAVRIVKAVPPPRSIPGYQLLGRLGAGAMGIVYKARQVNLDRLVAVKILPKKFHRKPEFVKRFYGEGRIAAKLNHPNIVAALDVGRYGDIHYFVMEYVEGYTAYEHIVKEGPYAEAEVLAIGIQIAKALSHAHQAGLIHRDVKPKNILITGEGIAKLADMGLARAVSDREAAEAEAGKACGTPYYISPEQVRGAADIDFRTDLYSFGATLYHMVTGQPAFRASDPLMVICKHLREPLVPPDRVNPHLSRGLAEIVELCMAKDPAHRYATTADLIADLHAVARGQTPIHAHRKDEPSAAVVAEDLEEPNESCPLVWKDSLWGRPLFWFAIVGWILTGILLVAFVLYVRNR
jgi:eukaryotic-like serine/threonine-protein kinase